jgi:hypothetical protein
MVLIKYLETYSVSEPERSKSLKGNGGGVVANVYPIHATINNTTPTAPKAETCIVSQHQGDRKSR